AHAAANEIDLEASRRKALGQPRQRSVHAHLRTHCTRQVTAGTSGPSVAQGTALPPRHDRARAKAVSRSGRPLRTMVPALARVSRWPVAPKARSARAWQDFPRPRPAVRPVEALRTDLRSACS